MEAAFPRHHTHHHPLGLGRATGTDALPLWRVVRQELDRRYIPGTDPVEEWVVYFVTRSGSEAYVRIPREAYTPENVAAVITPEAEIIEHVAGLRHKS